MDDDIAEAAGKLGLVRRTQLLHRPVPRGLGAALARLEGQEAIGRLVRRFRSMDRAGAPTHNGRIVLRGYDSLPVTLQ